VTFLGKRSGFKSLRDFLLFSTGLFIDLYHLFTTAPADLSVGVLIFGAALAGSPSVLRSDERYEDREDYEIEPSRKRKRRATDGATDDSEEEDDGDKADSSG
jgi:hypothetical protein